MATAKKPEAKSAGRHPEWMVPTEDGPVSEREMRQRELAGARKKRESVAKKNAELRKPAEEPEGSEGNDE